MAAAVFAFSHARSSIILQPIRPKPLVCTVLNAVAILIVVIDLVWVIQMTRMFSAMSAADMPNLPGADWQFTMRSMTLIMLLIPASFFWGFSVLIEKVASINERMRGTAGGAAAPVDSPLRDALLR